MKLHCYWSVVSAFFGALIHCDAWIAPLPSIASFPRSSSIETKDNTRFRNRSDRDMIGTGFSFEDGEQILVSIQKPFGIILEQGSEEDDDGRIFVTCKELQILKRMMFCEHFFIPPVYFHPLMI